MTAYKRDDKAFKARMAAKADTLAAKPFAKTAQRIATVTIDERGDMVFLATDANDIFLELGETVTTRASHVEPVGRLARVAFHFLRLFGNKTRIAEWTRGWDVEWRINTKPTAGVVLPKTYRDRREAIAAEVTFLNQFFLTGRTQ